MDNLIASGVELMLLGMGTVFVFLSLLVFATTVMSRVIMRLQPSTPNQSNSAVSPAVLPDSSEPTQVPDEELVAVISTAIQKYRSRHK